ncbi:unnamed protein product [Pseudo-nitzschia multistriata]|uniref:Transmembrane protein n=1 Tax=Pseudo-nitzschia multistriata TaxID=183589 RepID=A0A448ZPR2_9STRA|nr:unnamed protein product [Pseudo-nitzschia multistriata]
MFIRNCRVSSIDVSDIFRHLRRRLLRIFRSEVYTSCCLLSLSPAFTVRSKTPLLSFLRLDREEERPLLRLFLVSDGRERLRLPSRPAADLLLRRDLLLDLEDRRLDLERRDEPSSIFSLSEAFFVFLLFFFLLRERSRKKKPR